MIKKFCHLFFAIFLFSVISCSNTDDSSGTNKEIDQVLDQPNSTDERNYLDLPEIPSTSCYYIDSSTIDNSTFDNSSTANNSLIRNSFVVNCSAISDSNIILSRIDNSSVDNSTVDNDSIVINGSNICTESSIDNATIDNATICNGSTVDGGSTVQTSTINDNTTVTNGSSVTNNSTVCNSTIDNSTIDNSTICTGSSMDITNVTISDTIVSETDAPNVQGVTAMEANGNYITGYTLNLRLVMNECVTVDNSSGNPLLLLDTGSGTNDRYAIWYGTNCVSGTGFVNFSYSIQSDDDTCDLDYKSVNSLELNGGTIRDSSANDAVRTLPSPGTTGSLGSNRQITMNDSAGKC